MFRLIFTATLIFAASALNLEAATLAPQSGTVHVNIGSGFTEVQGDTVGPAATKVMVSPGGAALVTYSSDCSVRLASGVWTVPEHPPCKQGVAMIDFTNRMNQETPPTDGADSLTTTLVIGGLIVGGTVAGGLLLLQDNNEQQESP